MRLAIMQPYFFPYIGYFQLIAAVDLFVIYDNIKYTKKGWINRNRMLQNGQDAMFTLPLKADSDSLDICQRELAAGFNKEKLIRQLSGNYRRAPYYVQTFPLIEEIIHYEDSNLFRFLQHSIARTRQHLGISTKIGVSSNIAIDHALTNQDKVIALCVAVGATSYLNPIGGKELYSKSAFADAGINLEFIQSKPFEYAQYDQQFVPWLSIIDVMMFNSMDAVRRRISENYELS